MLLTRLRAAVASVCLSVVPVAWAQADAGPVEIAVVQAPAEVPLGDILSGRARIGFEPIVGEHATLRADERAIWLRVRGSATAADGPRTLRLDRQAMDKVELFLPGAPEVAVAATGLAERPAGRTESGSFLLPIPEGTDPNAPLYVRIEGRGYLYLHPQLLGAEELQSGELASASLDTGVSLLLGLVAILGLVRMLRAPQSGGLALAVAAIVVGLASMASNGELHRIPGGSALVPVGPRLAQALWLFAGATLLLATRHFAGVDKHSPFLATLLRWIALAYGLVGLAAMATPPGMLLAMQVAALAGLGVLALVCIGTLATDPRSARYTAMLAWVGVLAALVAVVLVFAQVSPPTLLARRGLQPMLAMVLLVYLSLPWAREIVRERAKLKRAAVPEPTTEEMIDAAREKLMASLESGLANASEGDLEWIAYRRLLEGLKPVLPQVASAVVAMNYHHEDLLLLEPRDAEPRYRALLQQRGQLLKNLSRSKAPQQVALDFDGPDGPLGRVQLAVIPLPIDKPGWGALLIERNATVEYSEIELDLAAEFASLAFTAGDEAATALEARQANQYDPETGLHRPEAMERELKAAHETAFLQKQPFNVMRVGLDGHGQAIRGLADLVRDEIDYGETVGRWAADELLVLVPGLHPAAARELGERILAAARKHGFAVSIGVASMKQGERATSGLLERAAQGLAKVRGNGGNQVALVGATG